MVPFIRSDEILARVGPADAMAAMERGFAALAGSEATDPVSLGVAVSGGTFHVKACAASSPRPLFVAKVNANFPDNPARGLPTIQGIVALLDASDGRLLALMDSPAITNLRTAATTGVMIRRLARKDSRVACLVGCGALGRFHLQVLPQCGTFERVHLFDRDAVRATELAEWGRATLGLACEVAPDLRLATLASDVVITCTSSTIPLLKAGDVRPGTFIAAVGADNPRKSEIDASLLGEARIVADQAAQCLKGGDLRNAMPNEAFVCGELVDAVAGRVARTASDEVVVFDSTGLAIEDLALAELVLDRLGRDVR